MFDEALKFVLDMEGGFVDDPDDTGGATRFGITIDTLEMWRGEPLTPEDVRNLSLDEAKAIYRVKYWEKCRCHEMPDDIALVLFDAAVNHGPDRAVRLLQRAAGVTDDGVIGPVTLSAVRGEGVLDEFVVLRAMLYARLNVKFHHGWFRRLVAGHRAAIEL